MHAAQTMLQDHNAHTKGVAPPMMNFKPLKKQRITRFMRDEQRRDHNIRSSGVIDERRNRSTTLPRPPRPIDVVDSHSPLEGILWYTDQYYSNYFETCTCELISSDQRICVLFIDELESARSSEFRNPSDFQHLNKACSAYASAMRNQDVYWVIYLLRELTQRDWKRWPGIMKEMLRFMASMAQIALGREHPVSSILDLISRSAVLESTAPDIVTYVGGVCLDRYFLSKPSSYDSEDWHQARSFYNRVELEYLALCNNFRKVELMSENCFQRFPSSARVERIVRNLMDMRQNDKLRGRVFAEVMYIAAVVGTYSPSSRVHQTKMGLHDARDKLLPSFCSCRRVTAS